MSECDLPKYEKEVVARITGTGSKSAQASCSTLDEYVLIDKLAMILDISGPVSQEERNTDARYRRNVLIKAVLELSRKKQYRINEYFVYRLARLLRNTDGWHPERWGLRSMDLLTELREIDPDKYDERVRE